MRLLYTIFGLRLIFGTRFGCSLFALIGGVALAAIIFAHGTVTATTFLLLLLTGFALKRAVRGV